MSVVEKINQVMQRVCKVANDGQTQSGPRFTYLSEEKLTLTMHELLTDVGLVFIPTGQEVLESGTYPTGGENSRIMRYACTRATFQVIDADDEKSFVIVQAFGEGADVGDKVLRNCMTMAYKYALREVFMIATGDDPEQEARSGKAVSEEPARRTVGPPSTTAKCSPAQKDLIKRLSDVWPEERHDELNRLIVGAAGASIPLGQMTRAQADAVIRALKAAGEE